MQRMLVLFINAQIQFSQSRLRRHHPFPSQRGEMSSKRRGLRQRGEVVGEDWRGRKEPTPFIQTHLDIYLDLNHSVPRYYVGESEMEASKEDRSLADFRYGCVGYSVYSDMKNRSGGVEETQKELPVCVGVEILVDTKVTNTNSAPTHAHNKDNHVIPHPRVNRPAQSTSDDFFSRFTRNANIVASGVANNVRKVGNQIKESVDDILYPYRRRPK